MLAKTKFVIISGFTVLLTGGNSGIGAATARKLAHRNANVIIACRTREKSLDFIRETKLLFPESPEVLFLFIFKNSYLTRN